MNHRVFPTNSDYTQDIEKQRIRATIEHAFDILKPKTEFLEGFSPYQELFRICKDKFVASSIQHYPGWESAFIIVTFMGAKGYEHRFRIEGEYHSPKFRIKRILKQMCGGGLIVLAEFD
jgi:hypothetical protein